jgi:hypothetical protein
MYTQYRLEYLENDQRNIDALVIQEGRHEPIKACHFRSSTANPVANAETLYVFSEAVEAGAEVLVMFNGRQFSLSKLAEKLGAPIDAELGDSHRLMILVTS